VEENAVCVLNIGTKGVRQRAVLGTCVMAMGLCAGAALIAFHAPAWWRLGLFAPFLVGLLGLLQAREKT
jgi:hypothetical protein